MPTSYNFVDTQRLLIKPFKRLEFVLLFVFATALSQFVAYFIFSVPSFDLLWQRSQMQYGIATGFIGGILIGTFQWLILRKYVSDWKWILVVCLSTTFTTSIRTAGDIWLNSLLSSANVNDLFREGILQNFFVVFIFFFIGSILIFGYLQWYVLRPYVTNARWWIFIPFIALLAGGVLFLPGFLTRGLLEFNRYVIALTILPITQAIGFCILKKKFISEPIIPEYSLALAPDIIDYWDIKRLKKKLYTKIYQIWKTDLTTSLGELSYLVGVNHDCTIICYESINQNSADNIDQTPLPELANNSSFVISQSEDLTKFAKFQVVFTPPSIVKIHSWRGIPLIWLGVTGYIAIIVISALFTWLQIDHLFLQNNLR